MKKYGKAIDKKIWIYFLCNRSFWLVIFLFNIMWTNDLVAQSYVQTRIGYVTGRYRPLDKDLLNRDEHDFIGGFMVDTEIGHSFGNNRFSLLMGGKLQYSQRVLKGTYSIDTWNPNANIRANIFAAFFTVGVKGGIINRFSAILQANIGPSYILWYQDNNHINSFWRVYLPLDAGLEYELKNGLNLTSGVSVVPPIYLSTTVNYYIGIKKEF